ncbi:DUF6892 domain-containing protein [Kribbella sp. GL6]|uniref:DUF6892 domain-containing protein n=1 Tax=Kribbella sp. GL6 TaxID=3419765 RepID=UPI003D04B33E
MTAAVIDLSPAGFSVDGVDVGQLPLRIDVLSGHWGAPARWDGKAGSVVTWHDRGIYGHLLDDEHVKTLALQFLLEEDGPRYLPTAPFSGTFRIDGAAVEHKLPETEGPVNLHGVRHYVTYVGDALEAVEMSKPVQDDRPAEDHRYAVRPAAGAPLVFTDLNLKLAVLDELMYQQEVIEPKFSLAEFVRWYRDRQIDLATEGATPVPEALAWFERLEIDAATAGQVRNLVVDAGNEIYGQIAPQWDGEDSTFDIGSWEDLALLPNLEHIDFISLTPDSATLQALRDRGLAIED